MATLSVFINKDITPEDNILQLIHTTYPKSVSLIDTTNYTFEARAEGDLLSGHNSIVTITALPAADLTGIKELEFTRLAVDENPIDLPVGDGIETYTEDLSFPYVLSEFTISETPLENGIEYTLTANPTSLLYVGTHVVNVTFPDPETLDDVITGDGLEGFDDPSNH